MPKREPKTLKVAVMPDGTETIIRFERGHYRWSRSDGAYPFSAAKAAVEEAGGKITTIPNPNYRAPRLI